MSDPLKNRIERIDEYIDESLTASRQGQLLTLSANGDAIIASFSGNLVGALGDLEAPKRELIRVMDVENPKKVVLDFNKVNFIDSSGVGFLISLLKEARQRNVKLILAGMSAVTTNVFRVQNLDRILTIADTVEAALSETEAQP